MGCVGITNENCTPDKGNRMQNSQGFKNIKPAIGVQYLSWAYITFELPWVNTITMCGEASGIDCLSLRLQSEVLRELSKHVRKTKCNSRNPSLKGTLWLHAFHLRVLLLCMMILFFQRRGGGWGGVRLNPKPESLNSGNPQPQALNPQGILVNLPLSSKSSIDFSWAFAG